MILIIHDFIYISFLEPDCHLVDIVTWALIRLNSWRIFALLQPFNLTIVDTYVCSAGTTSSKLRLGIVHQVILLLWTVLNDPHFDRVYALELRRFVPSFLIVWQQHHRFIAQFFCATKTFTFTGQDLLGLNCFTTSLLEAIAGSFTFIYRIKLFSLWGA